MSVSVDLFVCVRLFTIVSSKLHVRASPKFLCLLLMALVRVLLWRRSAMLYTSGFMDDVMFVYKSRLLDVATQLKRSARAALGLAIKCAQ